MAQGLSAMMGVKLGHSLYESATKKHVTITFAAPDHEQLINQVKELAPEVVLLFVSKSKGLSNYLLAKLSPLITTPYTLLLLGRNDSGGKSADTLVKGVASCFKRDSARKCSLFQANLSGQEHFKAPEAPAAVTYRGMTLEQAHGLFSQGRLDQGTAYLLEELLPHLTVAAEGATKPSAAAAAQPGSVSAAQNTAQAQNTALTPETPLNALKLTEAHLFPNAVYQNLFNRNYECLTSSGTGTRPR